MKKIVSNGIVGKISEKIETRTVVTYNVALKMPVTKVINDTQYSVIINGVKYEDVNTTVYPSLNDIEKGMVINVFEDDGKYIFGDLNATEEQVINAYNKEVVADNWGIGMVFILIVILGYPVFKISEMILDIDEILLSSMLLFLLLGGVIFGSVIGGYYIGRLIAASKYTD